MGRAVAGVTTVALDSEGGLAVVAADQHWVRELHRSRPVIAARLNQLLRRRRREAHRDLEWSSGAPAFPSERRSSLSRPEVDLRCGRSRERMTFPVAGRRGESLALPTGRWLAALRDLPLVVQQHAAQRPPDAAFGAGLVDDVRDPSPRLPGRAGPGWLILAFGGARSAWGPRRRRRPYFSSPPGVTAVVSRKTSASRPALEGGVAMPGGAGLGALVNLPTRPFVPLAAGLPRPNHPPGPVRRPILGAAVAIVLVVGGSVSSGLRAGPEPVVGES